MAPPSGRGQGLWADPAARFTSNELALDATPRDADAFAEGLEQRMRDFKSGEKETEASGWKRLASRRHADHSSPPLTRSQSQAVPPPQEDHDPSATREELLALLASAERRAAELGDESAPGNP